MKTRTGKSYDDSMTNNAASPNNPSSISATLDVGNNIGDIRVAFSNSIPVFSGVGGSTPTTLREFIRTVDMNLEFSGLSETEALFWIVSRLSGPARSWLQANFVGEKAVKKITNWKELKDALQEKYKEPHAEVKHAKELSELKQGSLTVAEYTVQFNKAAEHFPDLLEKFKVGLYVAHLSENVAAYVKANPLNLKTLSEVQSAALLQNKVNESIVQVANRVTSTLKGSGKFKKQQNNFFKPQISTANFKKIDLSEVECRRCRKKGHYARECRTETKDLPAFSKSE